LKTAAVVPSRGIGDALMMMVASYQLLKSGYEVTTFHPLLGQMQRWFPGQHFSSELPSNLNSFDLVIFENDNSPRIKKAENTSVFYPTYSSTKHGPLSSLDQVFDAEKPMVENIAKAISALLKTGISTDNGLKVPDDLIPGLESKRIVIHPMSSLPQKNWTKTKYLKLARHLEKHGYEPVFALHPQESAGWQEARTELFSDLDTLACFLYESKALVGNDSLLGHLASNLKLPTVILADDEKRMRLWRPGWSRGAVITPSPWIPNFKGLRLREQHWQRFISNRNVLFRLLEEISSTV
jgi:heptosyltransferase-3